MLGSLPRNHRVGGGAAPDPEATPVLLRSVCAPVARISGEVPADLGHSIRACRLAHCLPPPADRRGV